MTFKWLAWRRRHQSSEKFGKCEVLSSIITLLTKYKSNLYRLVRERETEFRRQRIATTGTSADSDEQSFPTSPTNNKAAIVNHHEEASKKITTSGKASNVIANVKSIFGTDGISAGGSSGQKDLQYEMATARLKREMEENLMRERELFQEGRLKSLSAPEPAEVTPSCCNPYDWNSVTEWISMWMKI